jgi:hypothetical protein
MPSRPAPARVSVIDDHAVVRVALCETLSDAGRRPRARTARRTADASAAGKRLRRPGLAIASVTSASTPKDGVPLKRRLEVVSN